MDYISIRQILDDLLDGKRLKGLSLERTVNYAVEFMKIAGMPKAYEDKEVVLDVEEYRAVLPCDCIKVVQVKECGGIAYRESLGTFNELDYATYKIKGRVIFLSNESAQIKVSYLAIPVDEDGYPLIPDNGTYANALKLYIKKRVYTDLFDDGELPQNVLQNVQQEYAFAVGQAQSDLVRPSLDEMESIKNMINSLLDKRFKHAEGFRSLGRREILKF